ncbi:MAG: type I-D CRISPR-associated protein Cas5/Csc1 [Candidatus Eremiobacteraeota bacterium]|nr:type I-D CRISPR-associated protein Cas5/Csc1 [Candidatus Eremiobacteraeota bacterium]
MYASRELGHLVDTGDYLLNSALYYALGFSKGSYVNIGNKPDYLVETSEISDKIYITPAVPIDTLTHMTTTYNARPDQYAVINYKAKDDPNARYNIPRYGRERAINQQNRFRFYILPYQTDTDAERLASELPTYIRLGKKRSKSRVDYVVVDSVVSSGTFTANHPFGVYDYDGIPIGNLISRKMRPTPLILQGTYEGDYMKIGETILPYKLEFLKKLR